MFAARHFNNTMRSRGFIAGSAPASLAAMLISLLSLEKIFPRLASIAPLKCLTFAHLLCPAIVQEFQFRSVRVGPQPTEMRYLLVLSLNRSQSRPFARQRVTVEVLRKPLCRSIALP